MNKPSVNWSRILSVVLAGLKITGVINLSWVWVFAPLWIWGVLAIAVLIISLPFSEESGTYDDEQ